MQKKYRWEKMPENELLDMRICDLKLTLKGSRIEKNIEKLQRELNLKKMRFCPHFWISDEWYTPDGVPGMAIPFYLMHPKLLKLEQKMVVEAEGATFDWAMKLVRHETGHAIDNAYHLRKNKRRQKLFGLTSVPYPDDYAPKPFSKKYVAHLDSWYAQAHPDEDWAETFAVWLTPKSAWKKRYATWPAIKKIQLLDEIMSEIRDVKPFVTNKYKDRPTSEMKTTLKKYYKKKRERLGIDKPLFFAADLFKIFSNDEKYLASPSAARFIRMNRKEICQQVARWTSQYQYNISQILEEMIDFCVERNLRLKQDEKKTKVDFISMMTAQTMNYLMSGQHRIIM